MLSVFATGGENIKGHRKLLEVMDMSIALSMMIVLWVNAYVQIH